MFRRATHKEALKRSPSDELISKLDEEFIPTLLGAKYKTGAESDNLDRDHVRLSHDLEENNHSTTFDGEPQLLVKEGENIHSMAFGGEPQLLVKEGENIQHIDYSPGSILDRQLSADDAEIITNTQTELQSFPVFFRSTKTYLFHMLDEQIQYFKSLWHNFQDAYGYSLDLATFSQSMAILVAVEWKTITLDAFIMASDFLHKQNRHSDRAGSCFEVSLSEAECDELKREFLKYDKCLLTWELLHDLQEQVPQLFDAARAWHANRQATCALQRRAASDANKAKVHARLASECTAQAREYALLVKEHERTAEWHAKKAEAYSKAAEESFKIIRKDDYVLD